MTRFSSLLVCAVLLLGPSPLGAWASDIALEVPFLMEDPNADDPNQEEPEDPEPEDADMPADEPDVDPD